MNCKKEKNNGITLVALVVTIVVLLILAGITITTLFSDNGIINRVREAADATKNAASDTEKGLENLVDDMGVALGEAPKIKEQGTLVPITTKFAKYTDSTSIDVVPVPGGYGVVGKSSTGEENTIASGLVISDLANDTLDNEPITVDGTSKRGNQFVWVPVNDDQFNRMYDSTNKRGNLYDFGTSSATKNPPTLIDYSESSNHEPDIIAHYDGIEADDSSWFKVAISETMTGAQFKTQLEKEFGEMIASVSKYKGFYIGRYETSGLSADNATTKPTVQRGGEVGNANWYYQYQEIKNMSNNNATASMIWGCQFDRTLEWIAQTNLKNGQPDYTLLTNSNSWGNYTGTPRSSGYDPTWQKNHIYDLAGNTNDWTIEANNTVLRVARGGVWSGSGSDNPASSRGGGGPSASNNYIGSRSMLYIK